MPFSSTAATHGSVGSIGTIDTSGWTNLGSGGTGVTKWNYTQVKGINKKSNYFIVSSLTTTANISATVTSSATQPSFTSPVASTTVLAGNGEYIHILSTNSTTNGTATISLKRENTNGILLGSFTATRSGK